MWQIFLFRILPVAVALSVPVSGAWLSFWMSAQYSLGASLVPPNFPQFWDLLSENWRAFSTPVPFFLFGTILACFGVIESAVNKYKYGELRKVSKELRAETQEHGTSKHYYHEALGHCIRMVLSAADTGFSLDDRVTIYRLQGEDDERFTRIFRFSNRKDLMENGRVKIPVNEGVVGCAWANHGVSNFSCSSAIGTRAYKKAIDGHLAAESMGPVPNDLSMNAQQILARVIEDPETAKRVAVVVWESSEHERLNVTEIDSILINKKLEVARFVKHLGALDEQLNPDAEEGA